MMHEYEKKKLFIEEMNRLVGVFPSINNAERTSRIWLCVKNIPIEGIRDIVNNFLDNARVAPLPKDFLDAVSNWKRSNNFSHNTEYEEIESINCVKCDDMGIVRIYSKGSTVKDSELIRCDCYAGGDSILNIPQWTSSFNEKYEREKCPIDWFKPVLKKNNKDNDEKDTEIYYAIDKKLKNWKRRLAFSVEFWNKSK